MSGEQRELTFRFLAEPTDVNYGGKVHGGAGTHCVIVFVALDGVEGKPTAVPAWQPREDDDRRLAEYALKVMALSKDIEQAVASLRQG